MFLTPLNGALKQTTRFLRASYFDSIVLHGVRPVVFMNIQDCIERSLLKAIHKLEKSRRSIETAMHKIEIAEKSLRQRFMKTL